MGITADELRIPLREMTAEKRPQPVIPSLTPTRRLRISNAFITIDTQISTIHTLLTFNLP